MVSKLFKDLFEVTHVAMCISATCTTCASNGTNLITIVTQLKIGIAVEIYDNSSK